MANKVSLIIPVYNAKSHILNIIDDVKKQNFEDFEAIFVDDGSKDETAQIIKQNSENNQKIKLIEQKNFGVSVARRVGWEAALGEFVIFIDSDDRISSKFIDTYYSTILNSGNTIEFFSIDYENENHESRHFGFLPENDKKIFTANKLLEELGSLKLWGYPFMFISKKSSWTFEMFDERFTVQEDTVALVKFITFNPNLTGGTNHISCYRYCYNDKSTMHTMKIKDYLRMVLATEAILNIVKAANFPVNTIKLLNGIKLSALINVVAQSAIENDKFTFEKARKEFLSTYKVTRIKNKKILMRRFIQYILIRIKAYRVIKSLYSNVK